tara:strand:+ start:7069 stop:7578 length:510 start_codon:yes stop_codon:yes gene_type:complete
MKKDASPQRTQFIMMFFTFAFGMILSNLLNTQNTKKEPSYQPEILFIYRGIEKTQENISEQDRLTLSQLNQQKVQVIENAALRQHFLDQAQKQGLEFVSVAEKILEWDPVSEIEVNNFYQMHKDTIKKPFFEVKPQIKRNLELKRAATARESLLRELKKRGDLAILPMS